MTYADAVAGPGDAGAGEMPRAARMPASTDRQAAPRDHVPAGTPAGSDSGHAFTEGARDARAGMTQNGLGGEVELSGGAGDGFHEPPGMQGVGFPVMGDRRQGPGGEHPAVMAAAAYAVQPAEQHITWADEGGRPLAEIFYSNNLHYSTDWRMEEGEHGSVCCAVM